MIEAGVVYLFDKQILKPSYDVSEAEENVKILGYEKKYDFGKRRSNRK